MNRDMALSGSMGHRHAQGIGDGGRWAFVQSICSTAFLHPCHLPITNLSIAGSLGTAASHSAQLCPHSSPCKYSWPRVTGPWSLLEHGWDARSPSVVPMTCSLSGSAALALLSSPAAHTWSGCGDWQTGWVAAELVKPYLTPHPVCTEQGLPGSHPCTAQIKTPQTSCKQFYSTALKCSKVLHWINR